MLAKVEANLLSQNEEVQTSHLPNDGLRENMDYQPDFFAEIPFFSKTPNFRSKMSQSLFYVSWNRGEGYSPIDAVYHRRKRTQEFLNSQKLAPTPWKSKWNRKLYMKVYAPGPYCIHTNKFFLQWGILNFQTIDFLDHSKRRSRYSFTVPGWWIDLSPISCLGQFPIIEQYPWQSIHFNIVCSTFLLTTMYSSKIFAHFQNAANPLKCERIR